MAIARWIREESEPGLAAEGVPPPIERSRLKDLVPGRDYIVQWRHQKNRQRIHLDRIIAGGEVMLIVYRVPKVRDGLVVLGRARWLSWGILADFQPVVQVELTRFGGHLNTWGESPEEGGPYAEKAPESLHTGVPG